MQDQHVQQQIRIHGIILRTGRIQGRTQLRDGTRVDGIQVQVSVGAQHVYQGAL